MVDQPGEYRWSSYRANGQGETCSVLSAHESYQALGTGEQARQAAYRGFFRHPLDPDLVDQIRAATNGNYVLGSAQFQEQVTRALGRRVVRGRSGRPRKKIDTATNDLFEIDR